jgi:hypothetical protein
MTGTSKGPRQGKDLPRAVERPPIESAVERDDLEPGTRLVGSPERSDLSEHALLIKGDRWSPAVTWPDSGVT